MTEDAANALFQKWVSILKLSDWDIRFKWRCDPKRMAIQDSAGCTTYNDVCRQAVIEIADFNLYQPDMEGFEPDYEQVLVHELMHLKMSVLDTGESEIQNKAVHILVDSLAMALVNADRGGIRC